MTFPSLLHPQSTAHPSTNVNDRIKRFYIEEVVPKITKRVTRTTAPDVSSNGGDGDWDARDDGNYGSAATRDIEALQSLSRRIHYGMFVSESKFRSAPWDFIPHILASPPNTDALAGLITKPAVEAALLVRLGNKAEIYGQELDAQGRLRRPSVGALSASVAGGGMTTADKQLGGDDPQRVDVQDIVDLYRDYVIPLTKDVEVDYLVHRLDGVPQEQIDEWMKQGKQMNNA